MKRGILILPLLIMNAYAGNCYRMSNEELREIESSYLDNSSLSVKFPSGVRCDNAVFLNVSMSSGGFRTLMVGWVDLLSYGTLQKLDGKGWRSENLLSLAGVYKPRAKIEESSLPAALVQYLAEHPHIRRVVLRLDNDTTGRIAAETIKVLLPRKYAVTVDIQPPLQGKDYNDCLCMRLGLPITKRRERNKER